MIHTVMLHPGLCYLGRVKTKLLTSKCTTPVPLAPMGNWQKIRGCGTWRWATYVSRWNQRRLYSCEARSSPSIYLTLTFFVWKKWPLPLTFHTIYKNKPSSLLEMKNESTSFPHSRREVEIRRCQLTKKMRPVPQGSMDMTKLIKDST